LAEKQAGDLPREQLHDLPPAPSLGSPDQPSTTFQDSRPPSQQRTPSLPSTPRLPIPNPSTLKPLRVSLQCRTTSCRARASPTRAKVSPKVARASPSQNPLCQAEASQDFLTLSAIFSLTSTPLKMVDRSQNGPEQPQPPRPQPQRLPPLRLGERKQWGKREPRGRKGFGW